MRSRLLICTDLDRTLIPNGAPVESPGARDAFARLAARPEVTLAYVSGRHRALVQEAIDSYLLPVPDWVISDVGSRLYRLDGGRWEGWSPWEQLIAADWQGLTAADVGPLFSDLEVLTLQEAEKQDTFKLSFYVPIGSDLDDLRGRMVARLKQHGIEACWIHSVDEEKAIGLLDILPSRATKLHAVEFLMEQLRFHATETVFAGDSGNDLPILVSGVPAVLVANAHPDVIEEASAQAHANGHGGQLYLARGGFLGMNGNYGAGILEGVAHYHPMVSGWLGSA